MLGLTVLRSHHFSTFAGGVTLGIMMIPIAVRSTEEFLHAVPVNLREGGIELARQMGRSGQGIGRDPGPGAELAVVKTKDLEHLKPESAESFVRKLRTVWHQGEVRPPHRRQAARHWCTRSDPFETAKSRIHEQLSLTPEMGAKELFQRLQEGYPGQFSENQIRTLRRRVGVPCFKSRTLFQFAFILIDDQELSLAKSKEALNPTTVRVVTSMTNVNHKNGKSKAGEFGRPIRTSDNWMIRLLRAAKRKSGDARGAANSVFVKCESHKKHQ
jgi:hypothetical protein